MGTEADITKALDQQLNAAREAHPHPDNVFVGYMAKRQEELVKYNVKLKLHETKKGTLTPEEEDEIRKSVAKQLDEEGKKLQSSVRRAMGQADPILDQDGIQEMAKNPGQLMGMFSGGLSWQHAVTFLKPAKDMFNKLQLAVGGMLQKWLGSPEQKEALKGKSFGDLWEDAGKQIKANELAKNLNKELKGKVDEDSLNDLVQEIMRNPAAATPPAPANKGEDKDKNNSEPAPIKKTVNATTDKKLQVQEASERMFGALSSPTTPAVEAANSLTASL